MIYTDKILENPQTVFFYIQINIGKYINNLIPIKSVALRFYLTCNLDRLSFGR